MRSTTAKRLDPALWEESKREACRKGGLCAHSARKMQWAVAHYKKAGGRYAGGKRADNGLVRWTKEKWRTHDGSKSEGRKRYLPSEAWSHLTPDQVRRTNAAKRRGTRRGKQFVAQPEDVALVARRFRTRKGAKKKGTNPPLARRKKY